MPLFAEHREVRVTARESCKTPFVAPDQAPVRLLDRELDKGLKGWTDFDVKIEEEGDCRPKGMAERQLEELTLGTVVRRTTVRREVSRKRPTKRRWA
ncbi:hypothetical protein TURBIDO_95 [Mycobacterium phage Turbido]|uniref:Uncharacterized protein n=7 Tax=Turbidovirus TaxID=2948936 RepID=A0A1D8EZX0_9CAUD|nr:hypothetical protein TURBIDO_95 [Mycobacterium phage Turbido]YP_010063616.1 hypothetical protein KIY81_gp09 [Mycobacterium phage Bugsy]AOT27722.1 hypothetical protein SEA_JERM_96 [Mycobacterium phage Jerm]AWH13613.1 hypothetical protein SEA_ABBYPAIGE_97 [Mycobacterium phage AbbyPaige]AYD86645.1 hypothetical protein SEA_LILTURB_96 [Mycobacterium phage LilTurb]QBI96595.1 hypothetical protein SEA_WHABIGAIL7_93 [Mycobacterium phage Whabigail7]QWS69825.1 hypothetical protein SEA_LEVIATHAN_96 [M